MTISKMLISKMLTSKKADIVVNMIMLILLAVISIFLLMSLFSLKMPVFAKQMYCKTFFYLHSSSFLPEFLRQKQDYCKEFQTIESYEIKPGLKIVREFSDNSRSKRFVFSETEEKFFYVSIEKNISVSNFLFSASGNLSHLQFDICDDNSIEWNLNRMINEKNYLPPNKIVFTQSLNNCTLKCTSFPCKIVVKITGSNGSLLLSELEIAQPECFVTEEIVSSIVACWEKVNFGDYAENLMCRAISLKNCPSQNISERNISDQLLEKKLCLVIGNSDYHCGEEDNIDWNVTSVKSESVLLVEFVKDRKKIKVS